MKPILSFLILSYLLTTVCIWGSQQIETVVYPSEDEIAEAFALGEISFEQFLMLTELISNGIDPTSFLLDEIPNSFLKFDTLITLSDKTAQTEYFLDKSLYNNSYLTIKHKYVSSIDEDPSTRYQSSVYYKKDEIQFDFILKKEYSGRERFTRRYISYTPKDKQYTVLVGNYSKKFGLGGVLGYRGKLLSFNDNISAKSFLFPDYGGFNGVYFEKKNNNYSLEIANSYNQNDDFSILMNIFLLSSRNKNIPSLILGLNQLKNKNSNISFYDFKTSLYQNMTYTKGYLATELVADFNKQNSSSAILVDGKHKAKNILLSYSLWNYEEAFIDISGGSKTSLISEDVILHNIQETISSKRSNQSGGMLKSQIRVSSKWQVNLATIYAYKNSDTTELQLFANFSRKLNRSSNLAVDLLYREKERNEVDINTPEKKTQLRFVYTYKNKIFYLRSFISNIVKTDEQTYIGYFSEFKFHTQNYGLIHLWLNFSKINLDTDQLDYFYGFIKNDVRINNSISIGFKLSHRYYRHATDLHVNQFSLDASWQI